MRATFFQRGLPRKYALALVVLAGSLGAAEAQQKRLGLVVGLADYGTTNHPTALHDAGLVSQSLKSAGFEVSEAANLGQDEFRAAFREFTQKAASAGPDSVIAVYVAGVSLQDDGENILIPAGANLRQRTDLALEGLRLNDFIRALGTTPASARMVMFDTAYQHPYGQLVAEGARGLALSDSVPGMVIAYNNAPGVASVLPQSNYGNYAMALAEALREPGLNLNALFERVRLRVHDLSSGTQTPWHVANVPTNVVLTAPSAGAAPVETLAAEPDKPVGSIGADEAYARALAQDTIKGYEAFLAAHPTHAQAKRVRALLAARREALTWQRARRQNSDRAYWTYIKRYPKGSHVAEAESRLSRISAPIEPPPSFEEVAFEDAPPPPPEEISVFDSVVSADDGWAALPPPPPPEVYPAYLLPPPPVDIIDLPPPPVVEPWERALPVVAIGAGVVGAAILANRAWRRPAAVRPVVAPPVVRPVRPQGGWNNRPQVVLPPRPPVVRPPVGAQPGVRPGGMPGAIQGARPGQPGGMQQPQPGAIQGARPGVLPQPQPGAIPGGRPGQPGGLPGGQPQGVRPGVLPQPQPGVVPGARPGQPGVQPGGNTLVTPGARPGQPGGNPLVTPGARPGQPGVQPGGNTLVTPGARPGQPGVQPGGRPVVTPGAGPRPMPPTAAPVVRPQPTVRPPVAQPRPQPTVRPPVARPPVARPQPTYRPPVAQPRPQPTYRPPVARPAPVYRPPVARPAPVYRPPVARPAPVYRPPVAAPRPAPVYRPPAPVYRPPAPAARPAAPSCTPQMRAMRRC